MRRVMLMIQIISLVVLVIVLVVLVRRSRNKAVRYEDVKPPLPSMEPDPEPGDGLNPNLQSPVSEIPPTSPIPPSDPDEPNLAELEAELREIYFRVDKPAAFPEAKNKVESLAGELVAQDNFTRDQALRTAYERSLSEHREYLAAQELA